MPDYQPYDDNTQVARKIERYPLSFTRNPSAPLIERSADFDGDAPARPGSSSRAGCRSAGSFARRRGGLGAGPRAVGQLISTFGRVTDEDGSPIRNAVVELWQANSAGRYIHEMDRTDSPVDPNFTGQGRLVTDPDGEFKFFSIKPGAYPVLESGWWWRPPHIHFSILGPSWMDRFVDPDLLPGRAAE